MKPRVAITVGDPSGIGPEVAVPTEYSVRVVAVAVAGQRLILFSGRMTALFVALLVSLRVIIRSRIELAAEILALRHQLAVLVISRCSAEPTITLRARNS